MVTAPLFEVPPEIQQVIQSLDAAQEEMQTIQQPMVTAPPEAIIDTSSLTESFVPQNILPSEPTPLRTVSTPMQTNMTKKLPFLFKLSLIIGSALCGTLALGLLPFTVIGAAMRHKRFSKNVHIAGTVVAAPFVGMLKCIQKLTAAS